MKSGLLIDKKRCGADAAESADMPYRKSGQWREVFLRLIRNKLAMVGFGIVVALILMGIFADILAPYGYDEQDMSRRFADISSEHLFGTDNFGRDILSRIIYGARVSLLISFGSVIISLIIGGVLGLLAGYFQGAPDTIIMRIMDVFMAVPMFMLAVAVQAVLGSGNFNTMMALAISSVPSNVRILRATVLSIRDQDFVRAARATGSNDWRIIVRHILPNTIGPVLVNATLGLGGCIMAISGLSFVGLGVSPPTAEWGAMLNAGRAFVRDYWPIITFPGFAILLAMFGFNVFGDGLRDALDPRLKR